MTEKEELIVDAAYWKGTYELAKERIAELKRQVSTLEEYMLKGVAFRDELQARVAVLEKVAEKYSRRGIHATWCYQQGIKCACGLEELRAALDAAKEG